MSGVWSVHPEFVSCRDFFFVTYWIEYLDFHFLSQNGKFFAYLTNEQFIIIYFIIKLFTVWLFQVCYTTLNWSRKRDGVGVSADSSAPTKGAWAKTVGVSNSGYGKISSSHEWLVNNWQTAAFLIKLEINKCRSHFRYCAWIQIRVNICNPSQNYAWKRLETSAQSILIVK